MIDILLQPFWNLLWIPIILIGVHITGWIFPLKNLGIIPRSPRGLIGIVTAPFIHLNWQHLLGNLVPLILFMVILQILFKTTWFHILLTLVFGSGLLLWIIGRKSIHIGASILIYGLFGFIVSYAIFNVNFINMAFAILVLIGYHGLIWRALPLVKNNISWDGHLSGLIAGVLIAYFFIFFKLIP